MRFPLRSPAQAGRRVQIAPSALVEGDAPKRDTLGTVLNTPFPTAEGTVPTAVLNKLFDTVRELSLLGVSPNGASPKTMTVGLLALHLRIPDSRSLKAKRQILLGLKTRIRQKFNVSVAQIDEQDKWQVSTLGIACVGSDRGGVNRSLSHAVEFIERERSVELLDYELEFL